MAKSYEELMGKLSPAVREAALARNGRYKAEIDAADAAREKGAGSSCLRHHRPNARQR